MAAPNNLLALLSGEDEKAVQPWLEQVGLRRGDVLGRPGYRMEFAYFPSSGMISVVALMAEGLVAEVGAVGKEGMAGGPIFMGADSPPFHLVAQLDGNASRIPAQRLTDLLGDRSGLAELLSHYSQAFFVQVAQNAACNSVHRLPRRAARWLLTMDDRTPEGDDFYLTQEFLAHMLGAARQTVGLIVADLQSRGRIAYRRGAMHIVNREALEADSCECYEIIRAEYRRLVGFARPRE